MRVIIAYNICMNNRFVKIGEAAKLLGVSVQALRNWETEGKIMPSHRTPGGQRMYDLAELLGVTDLASPTIAYARVSSSDQKEDLERQHAILERKNSLVTSWKS